MQYLCNNSTTMQQQHQTRFLTYISVTVPCTTTFSPHLLFAFKFFQRSATPSKLFLLLPQKKLQTRKMDNDSNWELVANNPYLLVLNPAITFSPATRSTACFQILLISPAHAASSPHQFTCCSKRRFHSSSSILETSI